MAGDVHDGHAVRRLHQQLANLQAAPQDPGNFMSTWLLEDIEKRLLQDTTLSMFRHIEFTNDYKDV